MPPPLKWTEDRLMAIARLIADGHTHSGAARILGETRNAVVAQMHRHRISNRIDAAEWLKRHSRPARDSGVGFDPVLVDVPEGKCATGCGGTAQPGNRLRICAECDRKRLKAIWEAKRLAAED